MNARSTLQTLPLKLKPQKGVIDMTARQIITARLGRDLGPLATDLRKALYRLALELQRNKWRMI